MLKLAGHTDHPRGALPPARNPLDFARSKELGHDCMYHFGFLQYDDGCVETEDGVPVTTGLLKTCTKCGKMDPNPIDRHGRARLDDTPCAGDRKR